MLRWTVAEAGQKAQVSPNTVTRVEADKSVNTATLKAISSTYEAAGVMFLPEDVNGPGVRMRSGDAVALPLPQR